jgi:hypothetical protein
VIQQKAKRRGAKGKEQRLCSLPFALCPLPFALYPLRFALRPLLFALCFALQSKSDLINSRKDTIFQNLSAALADSVLILIYG